MTSSTVAVLPCNYTHMNAPAAHVLRLGLTGMRTLSKECLINTVRCRLAAPLRPPAERTGIRWERQILGTMLQELTVRRARCGEWVSSWSHSSWLHTAVWLVVIDNLKYIESTGVTNQRRWPVPNNTFRKRRTTTWNESDPHRIRSTPRRWLTGLDLAASYSSYQPRAIFHH